MWFGGVGAKKNSFSTLALCARPRSVPVKNHLVSSAPLGIFNPTANITGDNSTGIVCLMEHHCSKNLSYEKSFFCNNEVPSPLSSSHCSQAFHNIPLSPPSVCVSANTTNSNNNRERAYTTPPSFCEVFNWNQ